MMIRKPSRATCRAGAIATAVVLLCGTSLGAQEATSPADSGLPPAAPLVMTLWTAGAHDQPIATRLGYQYDRGLYLVGVQLRRMIAANAGESLTLSYTVDILPVVMTTHLRDYTTVRTPCGPQYPADCVYDKTVFLPPHDTYGAGIAPIGFLSRWRVAPALALQLRTSGGLVYFEAPVPDPLACKLNFIADGSLLADVRLTNHLALLGGLRLNHISNGGRGRVNPGMDSHMLEAGLSLTR